MKDRHEQRAHKHQLTAETRRLVAAVALLDIEATDAIALEVGEKLKMMVAPPLCYGMAEHHMSFSGSASVRPSARSFCS